MLDIIDEPISISARREALPLNLAETPLTQSAYLRWNRKQKGSAPNGAYIPWKYLKRLAILLNRMLTSTDMDRILVRDGEKLVCEECMTEFQPVRMHLLDVHRLWGEESGNIGADPKILGDLAPFFQPIEVGNFLTVPVTKDNKHTGWRVGAYCGTFSLDPLNRTGGCLQKERLRLASRLDTNCFAEEAAITEAA